MVPHILGNWIFRALQVPVTSGKRTRFSRVLYYKIMETVPSIIGNIILKPVPSIEGGSAPFSPIFLLTVKQG